MKYPVPKKAANLVRLFLRTFGYSGITIPPIGIYIVAEKINDQSLIRHENRHWKQAQEHGVVIWYIKYLWYNLRYGYWNNPFEVDARAAQSEKE